jgi:predicted protein tyrosine phosphatase
MDTIVARLAEIATEWFGIRHDLSFALGSSNIELTQLIMVFGRTHGYAPTIFYSGEI